MKNKSASIPMGMVFCKFYCSDCGERLVKHPRKRVVRRGDPDYREHRRVGRMRMIGDIEVTEYDFKCPCCEKITSYDDQRMIAVIQKDLGKKILSSVEITKHTQQAEAKIERKNKLTNVLVWVAFGALAVCAFLISKR